jgi:hypothetical protein
VLAERVGEGRWSRDEALGFARAILFDSPASLLGMSPGDP